MRITNRDLSREFGVSLTQIKRWAVICLGRDPEADQAGGVSREYSIDEAFLIYIFGKILVGSFHMGLKEAKTHMEQIKPQLFKEKLLPSKLGSELPLNLLKLIPKELLEKVNNIERYKHIDELGQFINLTIFGENDYLIEWEVVTSSIDDFKKGKYYAETHSIRKYFPEEFPSANRDGRQYVISLDLILIMFAELFVTGN